MEKTLRERMKEVEQLAKNSSSLEASISDLTEGVSIITDVISDIPKTIDAKISKAKDELKLKDGKDGKDGKNGKDGIDGLNGKDGLDGLDGNDGSPDTGKDIAKKLNKLKGVINKDVIIGLDFASQSDIDRAVSILDQRTQYLINKASNTGGGGAFTSITGTPTEVAYFDLAGNGTSDSLFTRNPTTKETFIGLTGTDLASNLQITPTGNTIIWDADTSDTITTKLEQNEDILGLGGLAGSALTWEDSSTQVQAFIGAVDASAVGLFPGSVLMVTNDNATGASANISTNYDNVLNVATAVANVANGDFESGFEFDDGRMIVRYRNTTTGFESAFKSDISGALTRYKLNTASDEYSTQLGNGVFQFFNSTTADQYMSLGGTTGIFQFGDISGASNDTKFIINDSAQIITNHVDGVFTVEDGAASSIAYIDAANRQSIFGNVSSAGGIKMYIDETVGINVQAPGAILNLGANTFGNETNLQVDDTTGIIKALIPTGGDFEVVNAAGNVAFTVIPDNFYTKIGDADNVGNSTSLIVDDATQSIAVSKPFTLKGYTVATLPAGVVGNTAYVTDALTPAFGATVVGGGAVTIPVFYNGTNWIVG